MFFSSTEPLTKRFNVRNAERLLQDADSTPTGTLEVNGASNAATVAITKIGTGTYRASASLTGLANGDKCELVISAAIDGVSDEAYFPFQISNLDALVIDADGAVKLPADAPSGWGIGINFGSDPVTLTLTDGDTQKVVVGAEAWVSSDSAGTITSSHQITNSVGQVKFSLVDGATYYLWAKYDGVQFVNGTSFVASKDA